MKIELKVLKEKVLGALLGAFSICLLFVSHTFLSKGQIQIQYYLAPPKLISHFHFGYNEILADSFWIRAIQDFDYCDHALSKTQCQNNSWLYKMLDAITDLAPQFRIPYSSGALALTIIISDIEGATKIFEKGVKQFPTDWPIHYRAAYHYMYEVKDKKRAAELLIVAGQNGAPSWVFTLAGRLFSDSGEMLLAENLLAEMKASNQDSQIIRRLEDKINSVKNK